MRCALQSCRSDWYTLHPTSCIRHTTRSTLQLWPTFVCLHRYTEARRFRESKAEDALKFNVGPMLPYIKRRVMDYTLSVIYTAKLFLHSIHVLKTPPVWQKRLWTDSTWIAIIHLVEKALKDKVWSCAALNARCSPSYRALPSAAQIPFRSHSDPIQSTFRAHSEHISTWLAMRFRTSLTRQPAL